MAQLCFISLVTTKVLTVSDSDIMETIGTIDLKLLSAQKPQWQLAAVGKLDTGATRTSIDVRLADALRLEPVDKVIIKNAHGKEVRQLVDLELIIEDELHTVRASVTNREGLSCPILIGRDILDKES